MPAVAADIPPRTLGVQGRVALSTGLLLLLHTGGATTHCSYMQPPLINTAHSLYPRKLYTLPDTALPPLSSFTHICVVKKNQTGERKSREREIGW